MSVGQIHRSLIAAASAAIAGIGVEYENAQFTPTANTKWAKLHFSPNVPTVETLGRGGENRGDGFLQIDINYPRGTGTAQPDSDADEIAASFPAGTQFSYDGQVVEITKCGPGPGRMDDQWYRVTTTVYWTALIPR